MQETIHEHLATIEGLSDPVLKANKVGELYAFLASKMDEVRANEEFFNVCRNKLIELVVYQDYDAGQRFFDAFEVDVGYLVEFIRHKTTTKHPKS